MTDITIEDIKEIVEIALDREVENFDMTSDFYEQYDMDSLGAVALVVEVQKRYDVRIPDEQMPDARSGEKLQKIIKQLQDNK